MIYKGCIINTNSTGSVKYWAFTNTGIVAKADTLKGIKRAINKLLGIENKISVPKDAIDVTERDRKSIAKFL